MSDVRLGPRTAFYRSLAREQWRPLLRHPEFIQGVVVLVAGLFTVIAGGVLVFQTGEAFLQVLFGIACVGWGAHRLWERRHALEAWWRIGPVSLEASTLDLHQAEPWTCQLLVRPRRPLVVHSATLTVWWREQRRSATSSGTGWAFDLPVPFGVQRPGGLVAIDGVVEVPAPPDAQPSRFDPAFTRQWTLTAELVTDRGHWRRDYPILVFPLAPGSMSAPAVAAEPGDGPIDPEDATGVTVT